MKFINEINKIRYRNVRVWTVLVFCTMFMWTGCDTHDFLSPDPQSFSSTTNYYETPAHFEAGLNSAYARLRNQAGVSDEAFRLITETRMDAMNRQFDINLPGVNEQPFLEWFAVSSNSIPRAQWNNIYDTIAQTNVVLSRIGDVEFPDQNQKDLIIGQAKFIRALSYWYAVQFWGGVPLVLEETSSPEEALDKVRASETEVYNAIIADLTDAASKLPTSWSESGRATSGAANFLLGRTYLLTGNYDGAVAALGEVEELEPEVYSLLPDYGSIFDPANENNDASVFELQFSNDIAEQPDADILSAVLPWHLRGEIVDNIVQPNSDNNFFPSFEVLEFFEDGSDRFEASFFWTENAGNSQYEAISHRGDSIAIVKKYLWPAHINASGEQDGNIILFRYADALLSLAEAHWRNGDDGLAIPYLNRVRNRAGLGDVDLNNVPVSPLLEGTSLESDALGRAIFNERTVELFAEGHRMFDLLRFDVAFEVMSEYAESRKSRESRIDGVFNIEEFEILLPIHPEEIGATNGAIAQNPGWE